MRMNSSHNMDGNIKVANFPIIVKNCLAVIVVSHNTKTKLTKLEIGKSKTISKGKKLGSEEMFPITLITDVNDVNIKAQLYSYDYHEFKVSINGIDY